jgi:hypothetical protein
LLDKLRTSLASFAADCRVLILATMEDIDAYCTYRDRWDES